jgi:hypothetical protein
MRVIRCMGNEDGKSFTNSLFLPIMKTNTTWKLQKENGDR